MNKFLDGTKCKFCSPNSGRISPKNEGKFVLSKKTWGVGSNGGLEKDQNPNDTFLAPFLYMLNPYIYLV